MRKITLVACLACLLLLGSESARACECVKTTLTAWGELQQADAVFTGEVIAVRQVEVGGHASGHMELEVTLKVARILKGLEAKEVKLRTGVGGGDCGIRLKPGERYLVYAYSQAGGLLTDACSRTKLLKYAAGDFKEIEEGVEVKTEETEIIKSLP